MPQINPWQNAERSSENRINKNQVFRRPFCILPLVLKGLIFGINMLCFYWGLISRGAWGGRLEKNLRKSDIKRAVPARIEHFTVFI